MKRYAFFDFDNTIYDGYTYEDFINYASENVLEDDKYKLKLNSLPKKSMSYNVIVSTIANIVGEKIVGWDKQRFVEACKNACSRKKVLGWAYSVTDFLKSEGFENIIVTASFGEMIADSIQALKIDRAYNSLFEIQEGKYTGKIGLLMNDNEKVSAIKDLISPSGTFSVAFGDSIGDAPMLNSCNMAFLVRGYNFETKTLARKMNWNVASDSDEIIKIINNRLNQFK